MRVHCIVPLLLAPLLAPFADAQTFTLPGGDVDAADLLGPWFNHVECYSWDSVEETYYYNTSAVHEQPSEFVPNGAIFLSPGECGSVERIGTIPVGTKLIVIPLGISNLVDIDDDINSNNTECPHRGTQRFEEYVNEDISVVGNLTYYSKEPFATVNGDSLEPVFLVSEKEFYLSACPNDPDKEFCDPYCDINYQPPEGCQPIAGVDVYPQYGWFAFDDTEWKSGETRTYNFGVTFFDGCREATYTLTAEDKDTSNAATVMCGMFAKLLSLLLFVWMVL